MTEKIYTNGAAVAVDVCKKHGAWFDENELLVAHREIARRVGFRVHDRNKWDHDLRFKSTWEHGPLVTLLTILAAILEEILD